MVRDVSAILTQKVHYVISVYIQIYIVDEVGMSILIRCAKCHKYYGTKGKACPCGNADKVKHYYVQYKTAEGKRKYEYAGVKLDVAQKKDSEHKIQNRLGTMPEYQAQPQLTFDDFMQDTFLPHYLAKNKGYPKHIFNNLCAYLGQLKLNNISARDIEVAILTCSAGRSDSTFNHYVAALKRIFNYAMELDLVIKNPVKTKKKVADNKRMVFLTKEQAQALLAKCKESKSPYLYEMVYIALYTGMRLGEIRTLRQDDVRQGYIYIRGEIAKSSKGRVIPMPKHLATLMLTATFDYNHDIKKTFTAAVKSLNIGHVRFHDLRHTYASWLVQGGTDLYQVKELLGHSTIELTQRYAHLAPERINISPLEL
jgi:integrase